jgi:cytochrome c553
MTRTALAIAAFGLVLTISIADGSSQEKAPPGGDIEVGKALAAACTSCHGAEGISPLAEVPHLAGQHADYIANALIAYKEGSREDDSMTDMLARLSDADILNVAAYYASLRPFKYAAAGVQGPATPPEDEEDPFTAVKEATAVCAGCHGEDGNSELPGTPGLAGQHTPYLIAALKLYRDGTRAEETMQPFAEALSDAEIEDMAFYYAASEPRRTDNPGTGDHFAGRAVTAACVGCHGEDGNIEHPNTPRLAGLDGEYLEAAVKMYKDGRRTHDAMREAVAALRDADIKDLAAFYATKEPKALPVRKPLTTRQWVEKCDRCHGPYGDSTHPLFPILTGQSQRYLVKALTLYHGGERTSSAMYAMSFPMGESDIQKLAAYYAGRGAK